MAKEIQYVDPTQQLISQLLGTKTTGTQTASIDPAAQAALTQLLGQMQQSTTPEGMAALMAQLFQTGAQQVPALTQAYANAAGARTTGNSSLQLALNDLNADITRQAAQLAMTQQQNTANVAGALANATKSVTSTQKSGMGMNPMVALLGGSALNTLNKKGWLDKGMNSLFGGADAPTAAVDTSSVQLPTNSFADPFSQFTGSAADGTGFSANLDLSSLYDVQMPDVSSVDIGGVTDLFGGAADNYGSISDLGLGSGYNFDSGIDWLQDDSGVYDFADGGQPARGRTDMGQTTPPTLQGVLQLSDAQTIADMISAAQRPPADGPLSKNKEQADGQGIAGPGLNTSFAAGAQDMATSALRANSVANMFGAGMPTGPIGGLVNAQTNDQAVRAMISAMASIAGGPIAGLIVKQVLGRGEGAINQGTPGSYADPTNDMVSSIPGREQGGQGGGFGGYGDRGPGGSTGDPDASAAGAGHDGPGYVDGGRPVHGLLRGPGTGTSDSIKMPMANLSNGEYIVSADVVNAVGVDFFDQLQAAFHKGGKPA